MRRNWPSPWRGRLSPALRTPKPPSRRRAAMSPSARRRIVVELRRALSELGADAIVEERGGIGLIPGGGRLVRWCSPRGRPSATPCRMPTDAGLHIIVEGHADEGVVVTVSDTGSGFDVDSIGADRLGSARRSSRAWRASPARPTSSPTSTAPPSRWDGCAREPHRAQRRPPLSPSVSHCTSSPEGSGGSSSRRLRC